MLTESENPNFSDLMPCVMLPNVSVVYYEVRQTGDLWSLPIRYVYIRLALLKAAFPTAVREGGQKGQASSLDKSIHHRGSVQLVYGYGD